VCTLKLCVDNYYLYYAGLLQVVGHTAKISQVISEQEKSAESDTTVKQYLSQSDTTLCRYLKNIRMHNCPNLFSVLKPIHPYWLNPHNDLSLTQTEKQIMNGIMLLCMSTIYPIHSISLV